MANVKPIPAGYHTLTPHLVVSDASRAIDFYKRAFGAIEIMRMGAPNGKVGHAELKIGDSMVMLSDEFPGAVCRPPQALGGTTGSIWFYTEDVDSMFKRAVDAGATVKMPVADMFWGDRSGQIVDPFGHAWGLATHKEDVPQEEMKKRAAEAMAKMTQQGAQSAKP